ncbi:hypothetical protein [Cellulomonas sp. P24]|uniref:hypothetical protein n=1 Tax=Cellulomonas sp. P24 TaxID=2885206 RepID=UPI00216B6519|nr:hypothetical protein [Cellulomonas sp. P24]MCR6492722.1 hypothetical protein [Cellulomonas sp. P24]
MDTRLARAEDHVSLALTRMNAARTAANRLESARDDALDEARRAKRSRDMWVAVIADLDDAKDWPSVRFRLDELSPGMKKHIRRVQDERQA